MSAFGFQCIFNDVQGFQIFFYSNEIKKQLLAENRALKTIRCSNKKTERLKILYCPWALIRKMVFLKNIFSLVINGRGRVEGEET